MKALAQIDHNTRATAENRSFAIDTTFVLFFLAVELGQSETFFSLDTALVAITLGMVMALPYFVNADEEKPALTDWLLGRALISVFAVVLGVMFRQALGTVLPETLRFLPMTLLIVTAMVSCYVQFYSFLKIRLAK
jgi:flagellar biosynthesis protein FliQ